MRDSVRFTYNNNGFHDNGESISDYDVLEILNNLYNYNKKLMNSIDEYEKEIAYLEEELDKKC